MTDSDDQGLAGRRAERLGALLARTDPAPRAMTLPAGLALRPRPLVSRWQLAAALLLLIAGAAGVPPVRAWIVGRVHATWLRLTGGAAAQPAATAAPPVPVGAAGAVGFPAMDPLGIRVSARQSAGGTLTILPNAQSNVVAAVNGSGDAAELAVGPDGLRIINRSASSASYVVRVPAGVSRIVVRIGTEREQSLTAPLGSQAIVLNLGVRSAAAQPLKE